MDVREKLIKICFREFCDIAGDSPCGCDGCTYGEYDPDNGGCFDEYKKDKIEKLENDMDKYQKEDNSVAVQEWIPVTEMLPEPFVSVLACIPSEEPLPTVHESYIADHGAWVCILTAERYKTGEVTHWMPIPQPPKGE